MGNAILLQDGATCHTARYTREAFAKHGIVVGDHPPQSPDLNAVEWWWNLLKNEVSSILSPRYYGVRSFQ